MELILSTVEYARFSPHPFFHYNQDDSEVIISSNKDVFIKLYEELEDEVLEKYRVALDKAHKYTEAFKTKVCQYCNFPLRYIEDYQFWGCPNYRDGKEHSTVNPKLYYSYKPSYDVPSHWVSEIIKRSGYKGKVKAGWLLNFFLCNNLEDLRLKYGYEKPTDERLNTLVAANKRSKAQELKALSHLEKLGKVAYQKCITYKLKGAKEKFCIPDFILGTSDCVKVIDAKLDYPDDTKMDLYLTLLEFILISKGDLRPVSGAHLFYKDNGMSQYRRSRHEIIEIEN